MDSLNRCKVFSKLFDHQADKPKTQVVMKERVFIIGGSSGMGLAISQLLHHSGYQICIGSRSEAKLKEAIHKIGGGEYAVIDTRSDESVAHFFAKSGPIDHLIITAADFVMGSFLELDIDSAKGFFESKFWGQYRVARAALSHMKKGGSITFFCGTAGQKPFPNFSTGCAINAAIEGLTRALAMELAPIRVNAIAPGTVVTPVWDSVPEKERNEEFAKMAAKLPLKRVGQPEDIAAAALYLIKCGYATGSIIYVDGGSLLV